MANHGWVETPKPLTVEGVTAVLNAINTRLVRGSIEIEYHDCHEATGSWGDHVWTLKLAELMDRVCWFDAGQRTFTMRHGGGGRIAWWLDSAILNEIALVFEGKIMDDGHDMVSDPVAGKFDTFMGYMGLVLERHSVVKRAVLMGIEKLATPPEFRYIFD